MDPLSTDYYHRTENYSPDERKSYQSKEETRTSEASEAALNHHSYYSRGQETKRGRENSTDKRPTRSRDEHEVGYLQYDRSEKSSISDFKKKRFEPDNTSRIDQTVRRHLGDYTHGRDLSSIVEDFKETEEHRLKDLLYTLEALNSVKLTDRIKYQGITFQVCQKIIKRLNNRRDLNVGQINVILRNISLAAQKSASEMKETIQKLTELGFDFNDESYNILIRFFGKHGEFEKASEYYQKAKEKSNDALDPLIYEAMMLALAKRSQKLKDDRSTFEELKQLKNQVSDLLRDSLPKKNKLTDDFDRNLKNFYLNLVKGYESAGQILFLLDVVEKKEGETEVEIDIEVYAEIIKILKNETIKATSGKSVWALEAYLVYQELNKRNLQITGKIYTDLMLALGDAKREYLFFPIADCYIADCLKKKKPLNFQVFAATIDALISYLRRENNGPVTDAISNLVQNCNDAIVEDLIICAGENKDILDKKLDELCKLL